MNKQAKDAYEEWCKPRMSSFDQDHPSDAFVAGWEAALSHAAGQEGEQCRAASGDAVEALIEEVQGFADAYPEDVFPPLTDEERAERGHIIQRAAAAMGRHMAQRFLPKALALRALSRGVPEGK